jgi:hypothetical protein
MTNTNQIGSKSSADKIGIGSRVHYKNGDRECFGSVTAIFRHGADDAHTHYAILVPGQKPEWWEQFGYTSTFVAAVDHVRKMSSSDTGANR